MNATLTIKQEAFAEEVFRLGNRKQAEAYRRAYPASKTWSDAAVSVAASRLMRNPKVALRVRELQDEVARANKITVERVVNEYAKLAFTDLPGIVTFDGATMSVADFDTLTPAQRACIQSFKVKTDREMQNGDDGRPAATPVQQVEVKLYSKQAALDKLGEFLGIGKSRAEEEPEGPLRIGFTQVTIYNEPRHKENPNDDDRTHEH